MIQEIIVIIIGVAVAAWVAVRLVKLFRGNGKDPCTGCPGCDLRDEFLKKRRECGPGRGDDSKCKPERGVKEEKDGGCDCGG